MPSRPTADQGPQSGSPPDTPATGRHSLREQDLLWSRFVGLAASVVMALEKGVLAVTEDRFDLVPEVELDEQETDRREVAIELDCLRILALYEPLAKDLRRMATILKVNRDWERIADLALRIARRARKLSRLPGGVAMPEEMKQLAREALSQVRACYGALEAGDTDAARRVIAGDDLVDARYRALRKQLKQQLSVDPERLDAWILLMNMARSLERIADHATGIAQTVVYMQEGKVIRHTHEGGSGTAD